MDSFNALKKLLPAFSQYYTLKETDITPPFSAEAEFRSHNEQYFLVRAAHIADIISNEFVYFAALDDLDSGKLQELAGGAWQAGLAKVHPHEGHRNSDVTLIILTSHISPDTKNQIKKIKFYKSYKFSLHGWSHFKLAVAELDSQEIYFNRFGKDYRKLLEKNIF